MNEQESKVQQEEQLVIQPSSSTITKSPPEILRDYLTLMIDCSKNERKRKDLLDTGNHQKKARKMLSGIGIEIPAPIPIFFNKQPGGPAIWIIKKDQAYKLSEQFSVLTLTGKPSDESKPEELVIGLHADTQGIKINLEALKNLIAGKKFDEIPSIIMCENASNPLIKSMEAIRDPLKHIFTDSEKKIITDYPEFDDEGYHIVVSLPFLDVNDNKVFSFGLDESNEVILTSC
jgi:hypothetical protein